MISRIWSGFTTQPNADTYEALLKSEIFPAILARKIEGLLRIELFRRPADSEVEFVTVMWFTSLAAVQAFAGENWEDAVVPTAARALLKRFDNRSKHYEVCDVRAANPLS